MHLGPTATVRRSDESASLSRYISGQGRGKNERHIHFPISAVKNVPNEMAESRWYGFYSGGCGFFGLRAEEDVGRISAVEDDRAQANGPTCRKHVSPFTLCATIHLCSDFASAAGRFHRETRVRLSKC
jgi:hypothetical protein